MNFTCDIGVWWGQLIAISHTLANGVIVVCMGYLFLKMHPALSVVGRLAFLIVPLGAIGNILIVFKAGCRDVSGSEWVLTMGFAVLLVCVVIDNLMGYRCRPCIYRQTNLYDGPERRRVGVTEPAAMKVVRNR